MLLLVILGGASRLFAFPEATGQYTQFTLRERVDSPYITYTSNNTRDTYITIYKMYRYIYTYGKHVYTHTYTYIYIFLQIMEDNISPLSTALNKNKTIAITHV